MIIDVKQTCAELKNEFEIMYDGKLVYRASLPFIKISGLFDAEKLREIKVFDLNNNLKFKSTYNYISNKAEEFIPYKYLVTNSQKFNQYKFVDNQDNVKFEIYYEQVEIGLGSQVIKMDNKFYNCYGVRDGYISHLSIYDEDLQVGELLKPNVVIDGKDNYRIYLKKEYSYLADSLAVLALYLDRIAYNSSYIANESQTVTYEKSYSKANKFYDKDWVLNNFDSKTYFENVEKEEQMVKKNVKEYSKKLLTIMGIAWGVIIILVVILLIIFLR